MKKLHYTLIELLAAMGIFIMMIGILFKTFASGADVASRESIKMGILSDANIFLNYLTNDLRNINMQAIQRIRDNKNNAIDPDSTNVDPASKEAEGKKLHFTAGKISFFSTVTPYDDTSNTSYSYDSTIPATLVEALDIDADNIPDLDPYIAYELVDDKIVRKMYSSQDAFVDDNNDFSAGASSSADLDNEALAIPVILEGVVSFDIKVWSDYPGGTLIDESQSPLSEKPSCITFSVTLRDPNPFKASLPTAVRNRDNRTISKTIYIDR